MGDCADTFVRQKKVQQISSWIMISQRYYRKKEQICQVNVALLLRLSDVGKNQGFSHGECQILYQGNILACTR
jgi:hypothetical protein